MYVCMYPMGRNGISTLVARTCYVQIFTPQLNHIHVSTRRLHRGRRLFLGEGEGEGGRILERTNKSANGSAGAIVQTRRINNILYSPRGGGGVYYHTVVASELEQGVGQSR